jgi:hypothetical protein
VRTGNTAQGDQREAFASRGATSRAKRCWIQFGAFGLDETGFPELAAIIGQLAAGSNLSVVGETTNLASRLQVQAAAGEVLLSAEAHRRVTDWLRGQGIETAKDRLELKGLAEPVTAFRLKAPTLV